MTLDPRLTTCPHLHSVPQTTYGLLRCLDCGITAGPKWFPEPPPPDIADAPAPYHGPLVCDHPTKTPLGGGRWRCPTCKHEQRY